MPALMRVFRSSPGEQYHTIPAYEFDPREMVADNNEI
jgi:hypothetical protein